MQQKLAYSIAEAADTISIGTASKEDVAPMTVPSEPVFRTPEEVAPELGMKPSELRRYCRISGHCTRLGRRRIMLDAENIADIIAWIKAGGAEQPQDEDDPFA